MRDEPHCLLNACQTDRTVEQSASVILLCERGKNEFFRVVNLPAEVDPAKATATLKDGLLTLTLPKIATQVEGQRGLSLREGALG